MSLLESTLPTLHNRTSSSSIQTLAATFEQQPGHSTAGLGGANASTNAHTSVLLSPYTNMAARRPSNATDTFADGSDNPRGSTTWEDGNTTPSLESAEQDDEFLPMSSPFTPGYSMSSNGSPTYRRDSLGNISPETPASISAAERREHSRRHSRIHSRNLSGQSFS